MSAASEFVANVAAKRAASATMSTRRPLRIARRCCFCARTVASPTGRMQARALRAIHTGSPSASAQSDSASAGDAAKSSSARLRRAGLEDAAELAEEMTSPFEGLSRVGVSVLWSSMTEWRWR